MFSKTLIFLALFCSCCANAKKNQTTSSNQAIAFRFEGKFNYASALCLLDNKDVLAAASSLGSLYWFNLTSVSQIATAKVHTDAVWALIELPSAELASGGEDSTIVIWNQFKPRLVLNDANNRVTSLAYQMISKHEFVLVSGANDSSIKIWNTTDGRLLQTLRDDSMQIVNALLVLPDGRIASGSVDGVIRIWDTSSGSIVLRLTNFGASIYGLSLLDFSGPFVFDQTVLVVGDLNGSGNIWNLTDATPKLVAGFQDPDYQSIYSMSALSNGLFATGNYGKVHIWSGVNGALNATLVNTFDTSVIFSLAFIPERNYLASGGFNEITVWDLNKRKRN